jgi:hypothetical protein
MSSEERGSEERGSEYPKFNGIEFGICNLSAGAEFMMNKYFSVVPRANMESKSFSTEIRKYIESTDNSSSIQGFVSGRISTRHRISIGFGSVDRERTFFITPTFGMAYDLKTDTISPFINFTFGLL